MGIRQANQAMVCSVTIYFLTKIFIQTRQRRQMLHHLLESFVFFRNVTKGFLQNANYFFEVSRNSLER